MNVVVAGPASSGTRFVSRWLEAHPDIVARHWSMPSGERWMLHWPTDHDFEGQFPDRIVFVIRSFRATVKSQVSRSIASCDEEAEASIIQAYLRTYAWAASHGISVYPVLYDSIVEHPERFADVFEWLGVEPVDCPETVVDGNVKWLA